MKNAGRREKRDRGSALVIAFMALIVITLVGVISMMRSNADQKFTKLAKDQIDIRYGAESGLNRGLVKIAAALDKQDQAGINPESIDLSDPAFDHPDEASLRGYSQVQPGNKGFYALEGNMGHQRFTVEDRKAQMRVTYQIIDTTFDFCSGLSSWTGCFNQAGEERICRNYIVQAEALNLKNGHRKLLETQYEVMRKPFGSYAMIFDNDINFYPKNAMSVNGDFHTNGNLLFRGPDPNYVTAPHPDGAESLRFEGKVSASGFISKTLVWGNDTSILEIRKRGEFDPLAPYDPNDYENFETTDGTIQNLGGANISDAGFDAQYGRNHTITWEKRDLTDKWNGRVGGGKDKVEVPPYETFIEDGYYAKKAGLRILRVDPGTGVDFDKDGTDDVTDSDGNGFIIENFEGVANCEAELLTPQADGRVVLTHDVNFVDGREFYRERVLIVDGSGNPILDGAGKEQYNIIPRQDGVVTVTDVDFEKLTESTCFPDNNLVYFSDIRAVPDATPENGNFDYSAPSGGRKPNGFRLVEGDQPSNSALVVTNNPLYIQGHFNRQPAAGSCDFGSEGPFCPIGLIADSITVLSENWNDNDNQAFVPGGNPAADTEINAAIIAGTRTGVSQPLPDETLDLRDGSNSAASIRQLEDWDGTTFKFKGSMAFLWESRFATSGWRWSHDRYYAGSRRDWSYDKRLKMYDLLAQYFPDFIAWQPSEKEGYQIAEGLTRQLEELTDIPLTPSCP